MQASWQQQLRKSVRRPEDLARILGRSIDHVFATKRFPIIVSDSYLHRMNLSDPSDPLLLQILPCGEEDQRVPGYSLDPLNESQFLHGNGLIQKYKGRLLVISGSVCAIHCRYCFRRNFGYEDQVLDLNELEQVLAHSPDVWEVILSGGDPLCLGEERFEAIFAFLNKTKQVRSIRIHTRMPVVMPARIDDALIKLFRKRPLGKSLALVIHANHANELQADAADALVRLAPVCDFLFNQCVLLKGINDEEEKQLDLCRRLLDLKVLPYYIHQLDPVQGSQHFAVDVERGKEIVAFLRRELPGYAVPRYVREIPGETSKTLIF